RRPGVDQQATRGRRGRRPQDVVVGDAVAAHPEAGGVGRGQADAPAVRQGVVRDIDVVAVDVQAGHVLRGRLAVNPVVGGAHDAAVGDDRPQAVAVLDADAGRVKRVHAVHAAVVGGDANRRVLIARGTGLPGGLVPVPGAAQDRLPGGIEPQ